MQGIDKEHVLKQLKLRNVWWDKPHEIPSQIKKVEPRPYMRLFYPNVTETDLHRAVVLMGPRRVGKSWMLHHTIQKLIDEGVPPKNIMYASFDNPVYNYIPPDTLLDYYTEITGIDYTKEKVFVFFDEIQYLKDWERYIKSMVDTHFNLKIIVSGSAGAALKRKSEESGAGRFRDFLLPPLSFFEFLILQNKCHHFSNNPEEGIPVYYPNEDVNLNSEFIDYINYGGFPEVIFSKETKNNIQKFIGIDVVDKVLLKDLPGLYGIPDTQELNNLFVMLAINTGNEVSYESLSQRTHINKPQIKKYIEYLESAFLIKTIDRIDINAKRFKRRNHFKIYLTNPSMRSAILGPVKEDDPAMGNLVETAIFAQYFHDTSRKIHYARGKGGKWEIDLVTLNSDLSVAEVKEVKWSDRIVEHPEELDYLIDFCHKHNLSKATITTKTLKKDETRRSVRLEFRSSAHVAYVIGMFILGFELPIDFLTSYLLLYSQRASPQPTSLLFQKSRLE